MLQAEQYAREQLTVRFINAVGDGNLKSTLIVLESMAQLAGVLLEATMRDRGRHDLHALLTMADRAKFRRVVRPGDKLELEARALSATEDGGQAQSFARVDGQLVAEAQLTFAFATVTNPKVLAKRREFLDIWLTGSAEEP